MIVIALLLIALAVAVTVTVIVENTTTTALDVLGVTVQATGAGIFLTGVAAMLALTAGVWLLSVSVGRTRRRRAEVRALRKERAQEVGRLEDERSRLAEEKAQLQQEVIDRDRAPGRDPDRGHDPHAPDPHAPDPHAPDPHAPGGVDPTNRDSRGPQHRRPVDHER